MNKHEYLHDGDHRANRAVPFFVFISALGCCCCRSLLTFLFSSILIRDFKWNIWERGPQHIQVRHFAVPRATLIRCAVPHISFDGDDDNIQPANKQFETEEDGLFMSIVVAQLFIQSVIHILFFSSACSCRPWTVGTGPGCYYQICHRLSTDMRIANGE